MKRVIRLTESDLHKIVRKAVRNIISEGAISAHDYIAKIMADKEHYNLEFIPAEEDIILDGQNANRSFLPQGIVKKGKNIFIDFDVFGEQREDDYDYDAGGGYLGHKNINIKSISPKNMIEIIRLINQYKNI